MIVNSFFPSPSWTICHYSKTKHRLCIAFQMYLYGVVTRVDQAGVFSPQSHQAHRRADRCTRSIWYEFFSRTHAVGYLRTIQDPEYPMNLEQLNVIQVRRTEYLCRQLANISVDNDHNKVTVYFTPTIPNCTYSCQTWLTCRQAAVIGLCIRVKLDRCLPRRLKSRVYITPGSHNTEENLNRQINDKERVSAALENPSLHILS